MLSGRFGVASISEILRENRLRGGALASRIRLAEARALIPPENSGTANQLLLQDESGSAPAGFVFNRVEDLANDMHAEAAGPEVGQFSAADALRLAGTSVVPQCKAHTIAQALHFQPHGFSIVAVGVPDDVCARLIQAQDQEFHGALVEGTFLEERPHTVTHVCHLAGLAGERHFYFHANPPTSTVRSSLCLLVPR
jgi:hypothetical protein